MAAIPCPQCNRILNLPDDREIELVSCPICKHAFAPPSTPKIIPASIPMPTERIPLRFPDMNDEPPPTRPQMPIEEDEDHPRPYKDVAEKALDSAGSFLRTMGWIGLAHTLPCCGCFAYSAAERGGLGGPGGMEEYVFFFGVSIVAYTLILIGARALKLRSSFGWAVTGVVVALLMTSGLILINVPLILSYLGIWNGPVLGDLCCGGLLMVPTLLVVVCGLMGGIKGVMVLSKPDMRELFPSANRGE